MSRMHPLAVFLASTMVLACGIVAILEARQHPTESLGGGSATVLMVELTAGMAAWMAGAYVMLCWSAPWPGALLAASGPALFLAILPLPGADEALLFTAALAGGTLTPALVGAAALLYPTPTWRRFDVLVLVAVFTTSWCWIGLLRTVTFDPRATGCFSCPDNLLHLGVSDGLPDAVLSRGMFASALSCAALALLTLLRAVQLPEFVRATATPVALAGSTATAMGAIAFAHEGHLGFRVVDTTTRVLWLVLCIAVLLAAVGVACAALRGRLDAGRMAGIVLGSLPSTEELRSVISQSLGDPELALVFPRGDGETVDESGRTAGPLARGVVVTDVTQGRTVVAQIRHHLDVPTVSERMWGVARGAGLSLQHASLRARLRAELSDLTISRARVVDVGDAERRRLERDLHDGAQQRLIALSISLQACGIAEPSLAQAGREIRAALGSLRELAHGIYPASLTDAGLDAALREAAIQSRVPLRLEHSPSQRFPAPVEAAVYRLVLDSVRYAEHRGDDRAVVVSIQRARTCLSAEVVLPGHHPHNDVSAAIQPAGDRFAALRGRVAIRDDGHRVVVEGYLPCA